jgi:hypothetical protein
MSFFKKQSVRLWTGFNWLNVTSRCGVFRTRSECLVSIKNGKFLDKLSDYSLLKDIVPGS